MCWNKSSRKCKAVASVSPGSLPQRSLVPPAKQNLLTGPGRLRSPTGSPGNRCPTVNLARGRPELPRGSPCERPVQFPSCPKREVVCLLPPSSQNVECGDIKAIGVNLGCAVNVRAVGVDRACMEPSFPPWGRRGAGVRVSLAGPCGRGPDPAWQAPGWKEPGPLTEKTLCPPRGSCAHLPMPERNFAWLIDFIKFSR